jgi:hypothetical protein
MIDPEVIVMLAVVLVIGTLVIVLPAYQAYRRGYNPVVWGLAGVFALNPIFILVVLAMAPHRARVRLRRQYREELDRKLAAIRGGPDGPSRPGSVGVDERSVGDQVTELPQRSIGDDQTRL